MSRSDILLILSGAVGALVLIMLLGFVRALYLRGRRKRQAALAWRAPLPQGEHSAIAEIRKEADASHQRYLQRVAEEDRRRIEADWIRDGRILLDRRKPPEGTP